MNDHEKIYLDLKGIFNLQLKEFYRQWKLAGNSADPMLSDEVENFLVDKINGGIDNLHDNKKAIEVVVAVFMTMLINNIENDNT
jgi:hypothetical protein